MTIKTLAILLGEHPCIMNIFLGPVTVHYREVLLYCYHHPPRSCGLVYQITCPQCQDLYVGGTGRTLATRMKDQTSHNTQTTAVGDHCRDHGHVISKNNVEVLARPERKAGFKVRKPSKSRPVSQPSTEIRDSTWPRSTAKYYRSHVTAIVRPAVTNPCHRGSC